MINILATLLITGGVTASSSQVYTTQANANVDMRTCVISETNGDGDTNSVVLRYWGEGVIHYNTPSNWNYISTTSGLYFECYHNDTLYNTYYVYTDYEGFELSSNYHINWKSDVTNNLFFSVDQLQSHQLKFTFNNGFSSPFVFYNSYLQNFIYSYIYTDFTIPDTYFSRLYSINDLNDSNAIENWEMSIAYANILTSSETNNDIIYKQGYQTGYTYGYDEGKNIGKVEGIEEGKTIGYALGFDDGFNADSTATSIFSGILAVGLSPVNMLLSIFDFTILGIDFRAFVCALLSFAVAVIVLRFVVGGKASGK